MLKDVWNRFVDWALGRLLSVMKKQWQGFTLGVIIILALGVWWAGPIIWRYFEMGSYVGMYQIKKGDVVSVSALELDIWFRPEIYGDEYRCWYPCFGLIIDRYKEGNYERWAPGNRLGVACKSGYYTLDLKDILVKDGDTVAYFDVYRKVYPLDKTGDGLVP